MKNYIINFCRSGRYAKEIFMCMCALHVHVCFTCACVLYMCMCALLFNYNKQVFHKFTVAYNDTYRIQNTLPMRCRASNMFVMVKLFVHANVLCERRYVLCSDDKNE